MEEAPALILGFVGNLMFTTRIETAAASVGLNIHWVESPEGWEEPKPDKISKINPVLILVDLGMHGINWNQWIKMVKSNPKTQKIPIICFGSHLDTKTFKVVKNAGADQVYARSRFFSSLPEIIQKSTLL